MTTLAKSDAKRVAIYDDTLGNIDMGWGGNNLLYQRMDTRKMT